MQEGLRDVVDLALGGAIFAALLSVFEPPRRLGPSLLVRLVALMIAIGLAATFRFWLDVDLT